MCEAQTTKVPGWKGWLDVPKPTISGASGGWIDLSHRLTEELSRIPSFPQPRIRQITKIPDHRANVTEVHMVVHHGTHLDAPRHFIADGPTMDQVPLDRLYGPGVVWHFDVAADGVLDVADFERATPRLRAGDIVLIDTGRAKYVNTDLYMQHACLSGEAAAWLVNNERAKLRDRGAFYVHVEPGRGMPKWCVLALNALSRRAKKWTVAWAHGAGAVVYRVEWRSWRGRRR